MEETLAPVREMREIRIAGRGGHGVVTAGEMLGLAAVLEGRWAQAIPAFGPERRGALSSCTLRVSKEEILLKCGPLSPDVLLVLDPTIWRHAPVAVGLAPGATLVFNSGLSPREIAKDLPPAAGARRILTVDATDLALRFLGRAIPNTAMMGALAAATDLVSLASVEEVIRRRFSGKAEANVAAARAAGEHLREL